MVGAPPHPRARTGAGRSGGAQGKDVPTAHQQQQRRRAAHGPPAAHSEECRQRREGRMRWGWQQRLRFVITFAIVVLAASYILDNYVDPLAIAEYLGLRESIEAWARRNEKWLKQLYQHAGSHGHGHDHVGGF